MSNTQPMGIQFYPTPVAVIDAMLAPYEQEYERAATVFANSKTYTVKGVPHARIFEPSGGRGDIADAVVDRYRFRPDRVTVCEIDPDLNAVLRSKKYTVAGFDFLQYTERIRSSLILMNPPFRDGAKHLLHAWELADGCDIACVLNRETIDNPYTSERRRLAQIIDIFEGSVEYIGRAFANAPVVADVDCIIVRLTKPASERVIDFDEFTDLEHEELFTAKHGANVNLPSSSSAIESVVAQYNAARAALQRKHDSVDAVTYFTKGVSVQWGKASTYDEDTAALRAGFWQYVFESLRIGKMATAKFKRDFDEQVEQMQSLAFSVNNIAQVIRHFVDKRDEIMTRCMIDVFDQATRYHKATVNHREGWKNNRAHMIAPKLVVPNAVSQEFSWRISYYHGNEDFLRDIDKALCFANEIPFGEVHTLADAVREKCDRINRGEPYDEPFESDHFEKIRVFKKGTLHAKFKDTDMLARLNAKVAAAKGWTDLPDGDYVQR